MPPKKSHARPTPNAVIANSAGMKHRRNAIDISVMHSGTHQCGGVTIVRNTRSASDPISPARLSFS